jgi:hypothetical protein
MTGEIRGRCFEAIRNGSGQMIRGNWSRGHGADEYERDLRNKSRLKRLEPKEI